MRKNSCSTHLTLSSKGRVTINIAKALCIPGNVDAEEVLGITGFSHLPGRPADVLPAMAAEACRHGPCEGPAVLPALVREPARDHGRPDRGSTETGRLMDLCGERGRYAVGSGNSVPSYIPVANYLAMVEEAVTRRGLT